MPNKIPIIGFTTGDLNGVGLEILIKTLSNKSFTELCTPVVFASGNSFSFYKKKLTGYDFPYFTVKGVNWIPGKVNLYTTWNEEIKIEPGAIIETGARYAIKSLEKAVEFIKLGFIDALVTNPVSKENLHRAGFSFPGHTEYLGNQFNVKPIMIMVWDNLRVAPFSGHIPLASVSAALSVDGLVQFIQTLDNSLKRDFYISRPVIAVLGVNPHAGDKGLLGKEEIEIIQPAVQKLQNKGFLVSAPFSPDGFWASHAYEKYDCIVSMYHDQGLIPFKMLAGREGVNYTANLPIVRVSPDHGPAFDIAGKNLADEQSLRSAVYLALDILKNRKRFDSATTNTLKTAGKQIISEA